MKLNISVVQFWGSVGQGEHYLQITDETGRTLSNEEYEAFLEMIGANCVKRF